MIDYPFTPRIKFGDKVYDIWEFLLVLGLVDEPVEAALALLEYNVPPNARCFGISTE